jgi:hypothetical protein
MWRRVHNRNCDRGSKPVRRLRAARTSAPGPSGGPGARIAAVSADGSTVCVLILRLNSSCSRSNCIPHAAPLAWRQAGEGEQTVARFLQAFGDGAVLEPPLADQGLAATSISCRVALMDQCIRPEIGLMRTPSRRLYTAATTSLCARPRHAVPHRLI